MLCNSDNDPLGSTLSTRLGKVRKTLVRFNRNGILGETLITNGVCDGHFLILCLASVSSLLRESTIIVYFKEFPYR